MRNILIFQKFLFVTFLLLCGFYNFSYAQGAFNPHTDFQNAGVNSKQCLSCHAAVPQKSTDFTGKYVIPDMKHYVKSGTKMCADCHGDGNTSHIVGSTPEYIVPADLPLGKNKQVTCLTCHYIHGSLETDTPMASTSFMDHLFNRQRLNKSYILRRNNSQGDLCLACHSKQ